MQAAAHALTPYADTQEPLRELLSTLASETGYLAACADQLQLLFGQLMGDPPVRPHDALERAQTLDALVQRLEGMEAFLQGLCTTPLTDLKANAAQAAAALRLTSQAHRFSPESVGADAEGPAGDCDLF